jgi:hypothetical protein
MTGTFTPKWVAPLAPKYPKVLRIDTNIKELEDPIEVSLSKYKKEIIESALRFLA